MSPITSSTAEISTRVIMGRMRTKKVKKSSPQVIENYYSRMNLAFHTNKKILEEVAIIPSKRLRNKISGFSTHLMKRIQKGPMVESPSSSRRKSMRRMDGGDELINPFFKKISS
ncbi:unnamed protein product [Eruca vesicaria subsp. sativa]|uniref:Ribosomal protein S17 n=1 Tax=Eruca vesicaria subsp. sativa TaxID=29727 RepID=A0ABC8M4I2_ERUVS|nr:unnamed protein product [Eruca vesicaria subsp. sativa]